MRPLAVHLLTMLLENAGSIVAREKLRDRLWERKVVEWEMGLHRIAKEIRSALGDDARKPRFIETVARRGYRFCTSIESAEVDRNAQLGVNRVKWFLAGVFTIPGMVLTFCLAVGIAG
ncbi:MAG: winged helix-turn-helix domain-containing protein [Proteobacteria bacterium]|nr:winged helix-turn-helix domain-containing protein [Pseudomonadota bacterium]